MKTTLFCYSPTGNSRYIAQRLAEALKETEIVTIPSATPVPISERVGIILPVIDGYPPEPVLTFIREVLNDTDLSDMKYLFCIHTYGRHPGYAPLITELALQEIGCVSSYQNSIRMPDTDITRHALPSNERIEKLRCEADGKLKEIVQDIEKEQIKVSFKLPFAKLKYRHMMAITERMRHTTKEDFSVSMECDGCGACVSLCPTKNITLENGTVTFGDNCIGCLGCLLRCPKQAISSAVILNKGLYNGPIIQEAHNA